MDAQRYTQSQVLYGLQESWEYSTGGSEPFDADTQIYAYMLADGMWGELDLIDIFHRIEKFFNFTCSIDEWKNFFGYDVAERSFEDWQREFAPQLTFGSLAAFIASRAPVAASFAPIPVFGRYCDAAGVFTGIQQVAKNLRKDCPRFAPSTRIIDVMRGNNLDQFWMHVRWMTEHALPALPQFWRDVTFRAGSFGLLVAVCGAFAAWMFSDLVWLIPTISISVAMYSIAVFYKEVANPLPPHIVTFRDLSQLIANSRATAA
ncbi:hypothetical protein [Lacipirellula limnantheis]|uniref:Uncharacterized protein n=1 Tax=Lacipirellula limnantheis TaxID=2528024 RepID=A0A517TR62_9BACT|nr:hypothetical protein [Lacipirellula limnantheis]QDT70864.1 hypothetical protein I41_00170 [Lacipirellula limnantheis]